MQTIKADDLVDMTCDTDEYAVDLMYADAYHPFNIFSQAFYKSDARLYLHKDMAKLVKTAATLCKKRSNYHFALHDGMRPVDAQSLIQNSSLVQQNPDWLVDIPGRGRLLSPPGMGGHPRGMAIDISLRDSHGCPVDCGTLVDDMSPLSARQARDISDEAKQNRALLDSCMMDAATQHALPILLLPAEWWDFRFPQEYYNRYAPMHDHELPQPLVIPA